jgi:Ca-activated chloride channel homolog
MVFNSCAVFVFTGIPTRLVAKDGTMRRLFCTLILFLSSVSASAWNWTDWWFTADQQAQQLMDKHHYAQAAKKYKREDWSAAAAYKSGDYQRASDLYKQMGTEQGYYNEGNALAHLGEYEKALAAYNKALSYIPNNQDAQYNHKLISELLKKDKEQKQNKDQQNKDQQNKDQQSKDQQSKDQQSKDQQSKDQQSKDQQSKDQQNKDQQNKDQQNKDQQNKDQQNKDQQNKDQQSKDQQNKDQQNKDQQSKDQQSKDQQSKDQQSKDQQSSKPQDQQNNSKINAKQQKTDSQSKAEQEKQQAKEQWLRLIPDDPGGLLREKFLRDHLRRERGWYQ